MTLGVARPTRIRTGPYVVATDLVEEGTPGPLWVGTAHDGLHKGEPLLVRRVAAESEVQTALRASGRWATELEHPGLMPTVDVRTSGDEVLLFSAFAEEVPLEEVLRLAAVRRRPLPPPVVARMLIDLCEVGTYLHDLRRQGEVVLAAFRPDNVWIDREGRARLLEPTVQDLVTRREPWSKKAKRARYDAPERFEGVYAHPSDIWSLGVLAWEMLRNRPLYVGGDFATVAKRVATAEVRRADAFTPSGGVPIDAAFADAIEQCLARRPSARYGDFDELAEALGGFEPASHEEVRGLIDELCDELLVRYRRKVDVAIPGYEVADAQPPAAQPPASQPPASRPPASQPPASQPPASQPPSSSSPSSQPPASQPPATQPPASQPPAPASQPPSRPPPAERTRRRKILPSSRPPRRTSHPPVGAAETPLEAVRIAPLKAPVIDVEITEKLAVSPPPVDQDAVQVVMPVDVGGSAPAERRIEVEIDATPPPAPSSAVGTSLPEAWNGDPSDDGSEPPADPPDHEVDDDLDPDAGPPPLSIPPPPPKAGVSPGMWLLAVAVVAVVGGALWFGGRGTTSSARPAATSDVRPNPPAPSVAPPSPTPPESPAPATSATTDSIDEEPAEGHDGGAAPEATSSSPEPKPPPLRPRRPYRPRPRPKYTPGGI